MTRAIRMLRRLTGILPARHSLRVRLPLVFTALTLLLVAASVGLASFEVRQTMLNAGRARTTSGAAQIASLLQGVAAQSIRNQARVASHASLGRYLTDPTPANRDAAEAYLRSIAGSSSLRLELWTPKSERLIEIVPPAAARLPPPAPPSRSTPTAGHIQSADGVAYTDMLAPVWPDGPEPAAERRAPVGYLLNRGRLSVSPPGIFQRLVGVDARLAIGNNTGSVWTDLSRAVEGPAVDLSAIGPGEYRARDGTTRIGSLAAVEGTSWLVWVEFPRSTLLAPAGASLRRMLIVAALIVLAAAVLGVVISGRLIRPLTELTAAAEQITGGDYSRRVRAAGRSEVGRVGRAFNAMATEVQAVRDRLEERVQERTQALAALRESEEHHRAILETTFDGIITITPSGTITDFNPAAEEIFGYAKADVIGRAVAQLIAPSEERTDFDGSMLDRLIEMTGVRPDGTRFPIEVAVSEVHLHGVRLLTGVVRDITERKRLEETRLRQQAMEEQNRRIEEASRLKSAFVANMSHEFRTPLNAIIGFAQLMHRGKAGPLSPDQTEYLGDIVASSQHLLELINDVLDLAKVESGKLDLRPETVDPRDLIGEVTDIVRPLAEHKRLCIESDVSADLAEVVVDAARVKQILYNYLSNAIKFTPEGGRIRVSACAEGPDWFRLEVEDTGIGIARGDLKSLFVQFHQLDPGTSKSHQGTGLGLALTKHLVEAHGGRVEVTSEPGRGSIFAAVLPRRLQVASAADV